LTISIVTTLVVAHRPIVAQETLRILRLSRVLEYYSGTISKLRSSISNTFLTKIQLLNHLNIISRI